MEVNSGFRFTPHEISRSHDSIGQNNQLKRNAVENNSIDRSTKIADQATPTNLPDSLKSSTRIDQLYEIEDPVSSVLRKVRQIDVDFENLKTSIAKCNDSTLENSNPLFNPHLNYRCLFLKYFSVEQ